jgi:hypothetical protein
MISELPGLRCKRSGQGPQTLLPILNGKHVYLLLHCHRSRKLKKCEISNIQSITSHAQQNSSE